MLVYQCIDYNVNDNIMNFSIELLIEDIYNK